MNFLSFNWLDIVFAVILISFMANIMRKGLIKSLFGIFSFVISVLISSQLYTKVAYFIKQKTPFYAWFHSMLNDTLNLSETIRSQTQNIQSGIQNNIFESVQSSTGLSKDLLKNIQLPDFIKEKFLSSNDLQIGKIFDLATLESYISNNLADVLINILAMVITFTLVSIVMGIISHLLDIISFLPVIHFTNKIGGLVLGFAEGTIFLWIACMIISLFIENANFRFVKQALSSSVLAIKFYNSNFILKFLSNFITWF